MVFKRPGNSRDDRSNRSPKRTSSGDEQSQRPTASRYNKPSNSHSDQPGGRPKRTSYGSSSGDAPKSFSPAKRKPYSGRPDSAEGPARRKPYSERPESAENPRAGRRPYSGRPDSAESPRAGRRPYSGRPVSGEGPAKSRPYPGRPDSGEGAPKRTPSAWQSKSGTGDRPKRSFGAESAGEKKFAPKQDFGKTERPSGKKFGARGEASEYKPFRKSENSSYNKPRPERNPEEKIMRGRKKSAEKTDSGLIRLNRYISNAGICSRRKADELISAGVISVNGEVVSELGYKIDPFKDAVRYNGELLKREKMVYVLLNKPKDYITTTDDPQERRTVMQLVEKASKERIYPIGRLDRNTTGLLLMTNDGDLADKLSHPKNNIVKLYHAELNKSLTQGDMNKISFGLELEDGLIKPDSIAYVQGGSKREVGIQIHSGKNRIVRRIFEYLGYEVVKLDRAVYANLTKKDLPRGRWRYLEEKEVIQLKHLI
jgi:23S rRNA pseudouridine2605 synthase